MAAQIEQRALSITAFAKAYGIDRRTVYAGLASGKLRCVVVNRKRLVLLPKPEPLPKTAKVAPPADEPGEEFVAA